jgi:hypothetical protein
MNSQPFIPFIRTNSDEQNLSAFYADSPFVRVSLERKSLVAKLHLSHKLWIDVGLDGVGNAFIAKPAPDWKKHIDKHGDLSCLVDPVFLAKPVKGKIEKAITAFLSEAAAYSPAHISVPQLPYEKGVKHNKINRILAEIAADWRQQQKSIHFILPVILTNQSQLNTKTLRNPIVRFAQTLVSKYGFDSVWSVDSTLEDQLGTVNFERIRFRGIIDFLEELRKDCPLEKVIAGPYWGLGLVLWARGLATHFAMAVGSSYRYHLPGGMMHQPKGRIAIESLRRWVSSTNRLVDWLKKAEGTLPAGSPEQNEIRELLKHFPAYFDAEVGKRQVARAYRKWLDKIIASPPSGLAVALYQDLSAAFVTGKMLPDLPDEPGLARRPERVAEQLMLNCL